MSNQRVEKAVSLFDSGFNCSQAVFVAFADGLDEKTALRLATGFGGGFARQGEVCGAVCGGVMAIGLKYGRGTIEDTDARAKTYSLVNEFMRRFQECQGNMLCRDLLGVDHSTPEGHQEATDRGLYKEFCPKLVRCAAEILAEMLR